ncbi:hypothetical protein Ahy_B09g095386 isoform A [Arachis hypogaea]|uniref:Uncharacterized protein n=1 Tax=Arachis hypogaea TaxID=3818 RepID=A0A444XDM8_ARAHY|nr:hypothetical protein Ahy_B09g095386 isoform A [Arachis hypogaea]
MLERKKQNTANEHAVNEDANKGPCQALYEPKAKRGMEGIRCGKDQAQEDWEIEENFARSSAHALAEIVSEKTSGTLPTHHPEATAFNAVIPKLEKAFRAVASHQYENVKEDRMATIHITLCINHRGRFEKGPCGKRGVNVDTLNGFFVSDLLKDIGYASVTNFFWLEPGKELDDGLRDLRVDMDIVRMYEAVVKNSNRINVYTEHTVDEPVLVEENNMTPSKMRVKQCAKRVPTPKKSPKRILIVVEDEDDAEIVRNVQVRMEDRKRSEAQSREEAYEAHKQAGFEAQNEDNISMAQETAEPLLSGSDEEGQVSQPPPTPVIPDKPPSTQSQPTQPPIQEDQLPTHTACSDSVPSSDPNVSAPLEPKQLTQYTPHPYGNPLSQLIPQTVPPSETNRTPQNDQSNPLDEVEGRPKSFIPNPDPDKPPTFYVPVDEDDFSYENPGHHCYELEELHSIASDEDTDQTPIFPQSNADAPVGQVRLEVGMEFETLSHFRKAVRKFNINIGRSIFFARCDSTRLKAICYDEDCPWQIYCAKRTFPVSYQVKTFVNEHTYSRDNYCKSADGKWVIDELEERIRVQPNLTNRRPEEYAHN